MGIALAMYFNPARGTEMELFAPPASTPAAVATDSPEQAEAVTEPVAETALPEDAVSDEEPDHGEPIEQPSQRERASFEPSIEELRDHISVYRGLLCDLESRFRSAHEQIESADLTQLADELTACNTEIDGHLNQSLENLESQRDAWDDATQTIEQLFADLRADGQQAEAIDRELSAFDPDDDIQVAEQRLRTLLTTCLDRGYKLRDCLERARAEMLFDLGLLDQLTPNEFLSPHEGVLNRLGIETSIRKWRQDESRGTRPHSLAVIGVDGLPELNRTLGVLAVDTILGHVTQTTREAIRPDDDCGQYDGSKFLLFFPETGPASATSYLEQMRQTLDAMCFEHEGTSLKVTVSCGVVEGDPDDALDALFVNATETMEAAREAGGNRTFVLERGEPTQCTPPDYGAKPRTIVI